MYRQEKESMPERLPARVNRKLLVRQVAAIRKDRSDDVVDQVVFKQVLVAVDKRQEVTFGEKIVPGREFFHPAIGRPGQTAHEIAVTFNKPRGCVIASDAGDNQLQNGFQLERGIGLPAAQRIVKHALPEVSEMIFQNSDGARGIRSEESVHGDSDRKSTRLN